MLHICFRPPYLADERRLYLKAHGALMSATENLRYKDLKGTDYLPLFEEEFQALRKIARKYRKLVRRARKNYESRHGQNSGGLDPQDLLNWQVTKGPDRRRNWVQRNANHGNPKTIRLRPAGSLRFPAWAPKKKGR